MNSLRDFWVAAVACACRIVVRVTPAVTAIIFINGTGEMAAHTHFEDGFVPVISGTIWVVHSGRCQLIDLVSDVIAYLVNVI